jgi:CHAD domain-containing protein
MLKYLKRLGLPFRPEPGIFVSRFDSVMPIAMKSSHAVFQKLEQDLIKLSSKQPAKHIHRLRTGTRRLQILLHDLSPEIDRNQKKLLKALGKLRKRAGKVRDLDVQLAALRSLKIPREPRRKTQLMNNLIELRASQEKKLRKAVDNETIHELRKRLKRAAKDFKPEAGRDPLAVAKAMLERINAEAGPVSEALLHKYRILTKRARYAAEFAGPSTEVTQFIAGLKRIQDALGDWHDWLTLTRTASQQLGEVRESPMVAELHNVTGAKFRHAVAVLSHMRAKLGSVVEAPPRIISRAAAKPVESQIPAA